MPAQPALREFDTNPIHLDSLPVVFESDGRAIDRPRELLQQLDVDELSELVGVLRADPGAVWNAPEGVIQDPAGSAVGKGKAGLASAGGASKFIYAKFNGELDPIPDIAVKSAIFNSSQTAGKRVLHTCARDYRPTNLSPKSSSDRRQVVEDLANEYANAFEAFGDRVPALGADGKLLNLVPVSGAIFAGPFTYSKYEHLHPSYTICAIVLASDWARRAGCLPPALEIHFSTASDDNPVYAAAQGVMKSLGGTS